MARQEQLDEVVTATVPLLATLLMLELVGEMVEVHVAELSWVTVKVCPPMVMVPVLVLPVVLADAE